MLWNPSIRKLLTLSKPNLPSFYNYDNDTPQHLGFWFDSSTNDYEVVRIVSFLVGCRVQPFWVEIFSLNTFSWKTISEIAPKFSIYGYSLPVLNGALHWIGFDDVQNGGYSILGFDVNEEVFQKIELPEVMRSDYIYPALAVYKEKSLSVCSQHSRNDVITVWVMREYGNLDSWTKIWQLDESHHQMLRDLHDHNYPPNVIGLLSNGNVLWEVMFFVSMDPIHQVFISNPECSKDKSLDLVDDDARIFPQASFKFGRSVNYFEESLALLDNANAITLDDTDDE